MEVNMSVKYPSKWILTFLKYCYINVMWLNMAKLYRESINLFVFTLFQYIPILFYLLLTCGDVNPNPGPHSVSISHSNIRGLVVSSDENPMYKAEELYSDLCVEKQVDFICITESHLSDKIDSSELPIPPSEYSLYRRDRVGRGGGVCVLASSKFVHREVIELSHPNMENLWIEVNVDSKIILIGVLYRSPNSNVGDVELFLENLSDNLNDVQLRRPDSIFLLGDFNDRCVKWESDHDTSDFKNKLRDFVSSRGLFQLIDEPTRITSQCAHLLDLIITDAPGYIESSRVNAPIANSDHCTIECVTKFAYIIDKPYKRKIYDYRYANFEDLNNDIENSPMMTVLGAVDDIDDAVQVWYDLLEDNINLHIPSRFITVRPKDKPWMTGELRRLFRVRNRLHKKFKRTKLLDDEIRWKQCRSNTKLVINQAKKKYYDKLYKKLEDPKTAQKQYWNIAKQLYGAKLNKSIPAVIDSGRPIKTASEKCEIFNTFFVEQSRLDVPTGHMLPELKYETMSRLNNVSVNEQDVLKALENVNINKATGPDNIGNLILKKCSQSIARPLCMIFNKSFADGKVPSQWKVASVSPIFKKGDKHLVSNYRPVSLLPCVAKVQERLVFNILYEYCSSHNLLTWRNSGFKKLDSAMNQLVNITHKINLNLDNKLDTCLVFLDVSKAFDRVWHAGLLYKLQCIGITGTLLDWFESYLTDRKQRVAINGQQSAYQYLHAGVPQGSILGPLLFLIFINDIVPNMLTDIFMFADDTLLFETIESDHVSSFDKLNRDLQSIHNWSKLWLVNFNPNKTEYMKISRKTVSVDDPPLFLNNVRLNKVNNHKHLGVTLNDKCSWIDHIHNLKTKASKSVGLLRMIQYKVPRSCLETLYKSFIRPILEYGNIIFDASPKCYLDDLEHVQRDCAIICTGAYRHTSHDKLLHELGWEPLSIRRRNHRLSLMFKMLNRLVPDYIASLCPPVNESLPTYQLRNRTNLRTFSGRTTTYLNSFMPKTVKDWNNLPSILRFATSLSTFKSKLKFESDYKYSKLFSHGTTRGRVNHTRIRLGLSGLNSHRYNYNFITDRSCPMCSFRVEDPCHYFFDCPRYDFDRIKLLTQISNIVSPGVHHSMLLTNSISDRRYFLNCILLGFDDLTYGENVLIFDFVHEYINSTKRFG